ncbi:hypothetical protein G9U51_00435 [Calidifontibacter sp. DB0510]|uniref:Uncharacterized protein n=1 Tax=Metallococcus carri TaxID=1656884 RepID=A0A967AZ21_9MICO|nr:hypothetical protein [Metallococcus carri]NHN54250.1 hypothetical protein [Metallococcus carri]NOP36910.1 hypothetical protein [Calidifontibacter sp. DB2511S]
MSSRFVSLLAEPEVPPLREHELPMPPWMYGALGLLFFAVCLGILWAFRNTAARFGATSATDAPVHDDRSAADGERH